MLNLLADYVKSLAYFMVFTAICELLAPEGKYKQIISLVCSIVLIMLVLKPVGAVLRADETDIKNFFRLDEYKVNNQIEMSQNQQESAIINAFEQNCNRLLEQELKAEEVITKAINGKEGVYITGVTVNNPSVSDTEIKEKIKSILGDEIEITITYSEADNNELA